MANRLITEHRKSGMCCFSVFLYVYIFIEKEFPFFVIFIFLLVGVLMGFLLLKTDPVVEIDLDSGELLVRYPISLTKFLYSQNDIKGFNVKSHMYIPKHPFNSTYVFIEIVFYTTDNKIYGITSLTTVNFEAMLMYFYNTYPMVLDKKSQQFSEEKKDLHYKLILDEIETDKRNFWKQKKKDFLISLLIAISVYLFYYLMLLYGE